MESPGLKITSLFHRCKHSHYFIFISGRLNSRKKVGWKVVKTERKRLHAQQFQNVLQNSPRVLAHQVLRFCNKTHSGLTKSVIVVQELRTRCTKNAVPVQLRSLFREDRDLCIIGDNLCLQHIHLI